MGVRDTKGFVLFGTLFTRTLFILHGGIVLLMFYEGHHIASRWWSLTLFPLPGLIFELLVVIFAFHGREWKSWFCPNFLLYLLAVLPSIWLVELTKVEEQAQISGNFNFKSSHRVHVFGAEGIVTMPLRRWAIILESSTLLLVVFARWLLPTRHLSDRQLSNLWLLQAFTCADILELLDLLNYKGSVTDARFVNAVLGFFSLSMLQFTFIIGSDRVEFKQDDPDLQRKASTSIFSPGYVEPQASNPPSENITSEVILILSSIFLMNLPFAVLRVSAIIFFGVIPYSGLFFMTKNIVSVLFGLFRILRLTVLRSIITINVVPPPN